MKAFPNQTIGYRLTMLAAALFLTSCMGGMILADEACRECCPKARQLQSPCGDTGCGPMYHGAVHEEANCPDPCDGCNRWYGCNQARELPDLLAPWQLPPGRGFQWPSQLGYASGPCRECRPRLWPW